MTRQEKPGRNISHHDKASQNGSQGDVRTEERSSMSLEIQEQRKHPRARPQEQATGTREALRHNWEGYRVGHGQP
jgi:hypothetical protein